MKNIMSIFYGTIREFYDIERLWADAPRMEVGDEVTELTVLNKGM